VLIDLCDLIPCLLSINVLNTWLSQISQYSIIIHIFLIGIGDHDTVVSRIGNSFHNQDHDHMHPYIVIVMIFLCSINVVLVVVMLVNYAVKLVEIDSSKKL